MCLKCQRLPILTAHLLKMVLNLSDQHFWIYNVDLILIDYLSIILTATLASVGTAGVPGVGIIMLGMVLNQVGLPLEGIAIVIGVDRLLDMLRTSLNVSGDAMVTLVVNKSEK